jgi:hypothetical protein
MKNRAVPRRHLPTSPFAAPATPSPTELYAVGDRVTHDQYGVGRVIKVEEEVAVTVDFGSRAVRIASPFSRMTRL